LFSVSPLPQLGDERFDAGLLEHRVETRFGLFGLWADNDTCGRAKIGETAALVFR
jgi:hypothetical protein